MEFKSFFFSLIILSMLIIAYGVIIIGQAPIYNPSITYELDEYNKLENVSSIASGYRSGLGASDPNPGQDAEANTFRSVYGLLTNIFSSFDLVIGQNGMLAKIFNQFGIPSYVRQGLIAMILIGIAFTLIAIIFRLSRSSA